MALIGFEKGDRVIFTKDWDPGMAPGDPFYVEPVPQGTYGVVTDTASNNIKVKLDDTEKWPKPVLLWKAGTYDDGIDNGTECIAKAL